MVVTIWGAERTMTIIDILIISAAILGVITVIGAIALSTGRRSASEQFWVFEHTLTKQRSKHS